MQLTQDPESMTLVEAVTTGGVPLVLVSDPEGDYFIVEQRMFLGGEVLRTAHKIGPGDRLRAGVTRFAVMNG